MMRDTTQEDAIFKKWLEEDVFNDEGKFSITEFDKSKVLYKSVTYQDLLSTENKISSLNSAIHKAGMRAFWDNEAKWFHVKVNDGKSVVESMGWYVYAEPFVSILPLVRDVYENTYAGIASATNKWVLLFYREEVTVYGSDEFLNSISNAIDNSSD